MATQAQLKTQLERALYGRDDFELAEKLARAASSSDSQPKPEVLTRADYKFALWTAAVVTYARAFGSSKLAVPAGWAGFKGEDSDLSDVHAKTMELRDKFFAHTDDAGHRDLRATARGWTTDRIEIPPGFALRFRRLCGAQYERAVRWGDDIERKLAEYE